MNCKYKYRAKVEEKAINGRNHLIIDETNYDEFLGAPMSILLMHIEPDLWSDLFNIVNVVRIVYCLRYRITRKNGGIVIEWNEAERNKKPYFLKGGAKRMA